MFLIAAALLAATPSTLSNVVAAAKPGDTIRLAPANYGVLKIVNRSWNPPVVFEAAGATIPFVAIGNSSGVTWRGGTVVGFGDGAYATGYGFKMQHSSDISITGVKISEVRTGIVVDTSSRVRVANNDLSKVSADGIDVALSRNVAIDGNSCHDFATSPGAHPDCIQLWSRPTAPPTADVTITNNSAIGEMQGIGLFDSNLRDGVPDGGFDRITITGNKVLNTMAQGIAMYNCRSCTVRDNNINSLPGYKNKAQLNVQGGSVVNCSNIVTMVPRQQPPPCPR